MTINQHLTNSHASPMFLVSQLVKEGCVDKKFPCSPQGYKADHTNPINWMSLEQAQAILKTLPSSYHLGFSFTKSDQRFFIDLDKCIDKDGNWSELAKAIVNAFVGCYAEISQSGTGIHIIGRYIGDVVHLNKIKDLNIELYTQDRFVMLTGTKAQGDWNTDATTSLKALITQFFNKSTSTLVPPPPPQSILELLTDEQVLTKATEKSRAEKVFGNGANFDDLYNRNIDVLSHKYPPRMDGKDFDESAADLALANMLIAGGATLEQTIRLMQKSLLNRDKWADRKTYLFDTVMKAISSQQVLLNQRAQSTTSNTGCQETLSEMPQEYKGCYFVKSENAIYTTLHGLLNKDSFNLCFGSPHLVEPPYKTYSKHAAVSGRVVDHLGFKPELPHGTITEKEGVKSVNIYKPIVIKKQQGDMTPFFKFFNAMIPNERDQRILLSYAAVMVQKPGIKAQWCVVIQGVQGCGKSLFAEFITYSCGETYTHKAKGDEFENRFNSHWFGKTFILIEDPTLKEAKLEEFLKPLITSKSISFEGKGKNARMGDLPANFMLTLNDFELIQKRRESRRLAVFMSALQTPEDLIKAGLTPAAFRKIVNWKDNGGNEIFADFIHNYKPDPEFDFSGDCVTAPHTSTTNEAIEASRAGIEIILLEEIEQGRLGFKGGWISSTWLSDFLYQNRIRHLMPDRKRGQILQSIGYEYHPGLIEGRAIRNVVPDQKRPRLFIKKGHPSGLITNRDQIMDEYEKAQKGE